MREVCSSCGGALGPGTDRPPCLCELAPVETLPALGVPETRGATGSEARALRCPGCGGDLERGSRRCSYCEIELASVRCWRCFELSFAGSTHCGGCGTVLGLEEELGTGDERCPSCENEPLHARGVGDHRILECLGCGGVLVDHETLEMITRRRELEAGVRVHGDRVPRAVISGGEVRYRRCPVCSELMRRRNFGKRSGVIVDICNDHGVWFDADELTAVLAFVASGGMGQVREREREEVRAEIARRRTEALTHQSILHDSSGRDGAVVQSGAALLGAIVELFR